MYGKALREVNEVLENMDIKYVNKISSDFMKIMIDNIDWDYNFNYNPEKTLEEQGLSEEAKTILSIIYLKYFASSEEKAEIINQMNQNDIEFEKEKQILYDPNKIFEKKEDDSVQEKEQSIAVIPEKWYKKIFNKIKNFFKK